jgi:hypothetical protein
MANHGGAPPEPVTVDDVWTLRGDPARLDDAAAALRSLAAEFDAAARLLRRGQAGLGQMLDRLDVPVMWRPGAVTFFPHDDADVAAIGAAMRAAEAIRAAVEHELRAPSRSSRRPG